MKIQKNRKICSGNSIVSLASVIAVIIFAKFSLCSVAFAQVSNRDATSFISQTQATFADMTTELAIARHDVPARSPTSASKSTKAKNAAARAAIIKARLLLSDDISATGSTPDKVVSLTYLLSQRPVGDSTDFPKLTLANITKLKNLLKAVSPSYVVGSSAKTKWKLFAAQLAVTQAN